MPFTLSHPAIVLPLGRLSPKYLSITGLVIGSMLPDFEYFIRMNLTSKYSHTLGGIFYFCLPLGVLLYILFNQFVRKSLIESFPEFLYGRFEKYRDYDWLSYFKKHWYVVLYSLLIGICSHILWDMFTHPGGYFVEQFPLLKSDLLLVPPYKILQHGSTLLGGLFILYFIYRIPSKKNKSRKMDVKYWLSILLVAILIIALRLNTHFTLQIGNLVVISISALILSVLIVSVFKYYRTKTN